MSRTNDGKSRLARPRSVGAGQAPYERIKAAILSGELAPGQPLVESALAEWCAVSRTPIREALRRLQQDGLVDRTDHGMAVRERSPEEILDIYEARQVLEAKAGRVAAERRSAYDLRAMRLWIQRGERVSSTDQAGMIEANLGFHAAIWHATHNESLVDLLERLNLHLSRYPGTTLSWPGRWDQARREHATLVDSIEGHDTESAGQIALQHFERARDIRLQIFEQGLNA